MKIKCIGAMVLEYNNELYIQWISDVIDKDEALEVQRNNLPNKNIKYIGGVVTDYDIERKDWIMTQATKLLQQEMKQRIRMTEAQGKGWIKNDCTEY